jgi:hypothetical protein
MIMPQDRRCHSTKPCRTIDAPRCLAFSNRAEHYTCDDDGPHGANLRVNPAPNASLRRSPLIAGKASTDCARCRDGLPSARRSPVSRPRIMITRLFTDGGVAQRLLLVFQPKYPPRSLLKAVRASEFVGFAGTKVVRAPPGGKIVADERKKIGPNAVGEAIKIAKAGRDGVIDFVDELQPYLILRIRGHSGFLAGQDPQADQEDRHAPSRRRDDTRTRPPARLGGN